MLKRVAVELNMPDVMYIPFPRELYHDLVRLSDGRIDPASLAEVQTRQWLEDVGPLSLPEWFHDQFGERVAEFAEKYAPHMLEELGLESSDFGTRRMPLVWKEITVSGGSEARMSYGGQTHYAEVRNGKIADEDGEFSPSEWAYKVANRTSRNAWRDIWFKEPGAKTWLPAQLLREQAREERRSAVPPLSPESEGC